MESTTNERDSITSIITTSIIMAIDTISIDAITTMVIELDTTIHQEDIADQATNFSI